MAKKSKRTANQAERQPRRPGKKAPPQAGAVREASPERAEELRGDFLERAAKAFDRMFKEDQGHMITLDEREERAVEVSRELGRWVLERHVEGDLGARVSPASRRDGREDERVTVPCPLGCGGQATLLRSTLAKPPKRRLRTRTGPIEFAREECVCENCRRHLFPPRL